MGRINYTGKVRQWLSWPVVLAVATGLGTSGLVAVGSPPFFDGQSQVLTSLKAPRGLTPLSNGELLIAEVLGGRLLSIDPAGEVTIVQEGLPATLGGPGGNYPTGVSSAVQVGSVFYYVVGEFRGSRYSAFYRLKPGETPEMVAGGVGPDGFPSSRLTNPFDLVPGPLGGFLVSDSGANAVLHISDDGTISDYAVFPRREVFIPEGRYNVDVVPTGLAFGPDGALYLASFTGYPYPKGAAGIYRIEDRNHDRDALDEGEVTVFAEGFSAATDLAFEEDGALLVTEFSADMASLVDEFGIEMAARVPGRLVRWRDHTIEVVTNDLVSPTSVAKVGNRIFVSEEFAGAITQIGPRHAHTRLAWGLPVLAGLVTASLVLVLAAWWWHDRWLEGEGRRGS